MGIHIGVKYLYLSTNVSRLDPSTTTQVQIDAQWVPETQVRLQYSWNEWYQNGVPVPVKPPKDRYLDPATHTDTHFSRTAHMFVGAFTDDEDIAESLCSAGIPVWLITSTDAVPSSVPSVSAHIYPPLPPLCAPHLANSPAHSAPWESVGSFARDDSRSIVLKRHNDAQFMPNAVLLQAQKLPTSSRSELGAIERELHVSRMGERRQTSSRTTMRHQPYGPNPAHVVRVRPIEAQVPLPSRFERPGALPEWGTALVEIQHMETARKAHRFWMPISTFFSEDNPAKRERALINWLAIRDPWFRHLAQSGPDREAILDREDWRHFLSHIPERGKFNRRRKNLAIFDELLPEGAPMIPADLPILPYYWFDRPYDRSEPAMLAVTQRLIMWELDELTFRLECLSLQAKMSDGAQHADDARESYRKQLASVWDHYEIEHDLCFKSAPSEDRGIGSFIWDFSVPAIEAARKVFATWPDAPQNLKVGLVMPLEANTIPVVQSMRTALARFFCRTYLTQFQRFPIVPTQFPTPYVLERESRKELDEGAA
ncbi:hypothetical protein SISNIDRAFT_465586 [Sistotremastrum niveocremeum HHB9708]|uniref:Uncharacterized protein n=1 Tax=Sistotremastrum niveocremeum HHB9708 TaxID=1314777 RepID=A0A164VC40_9AGAM|nr:hypothetical protein SISNIDRAFT_465586 [Sistotremastrum niveocremeum HHB9708]